MRLRNVPKDFGVTYDLEVYPYIHIYPLSDLKVIKNNNNNKTIQNTDKQHTRGRLIKFISN
mgnify:CR=1 FL=1